jgi:hypothetical protein
MGRIRRYRDNAKCQRALRTPVAEPNKVIADNSSIIENRDNATYVSRK